MLREPSTQMRGRDEADDIVGVWAVCTLRWSWGVGRGMFLVEAVSIAVLGVV